MRARIAAALGRAALLVAVSALALGGAGTAVGAANGTGYAGPNAVAVPYTGEKVVKPADGWRLTDCPAVVAAGAPLVTGCDAGEGFTVVSPGYDPEFGSIIVPVALTNGRSTTTIDYVLSLEPPAAPEILVKTYPFPAPSGGTLLIPISDLGVECTACAEGGGLEVTSFAPVGAATILPTETHLVIRPKASFEGPLEVTVRFGDMYGGWSQPTMITVPVSVQGEDAPLAQHVQRPLPAEGGQIELAELIHVPEGAAGDAEQHILCGGAIHGTVVCDGSGIASYRPFEKALVDQFSFHVARGGDVVTGSVTLVAEAADVGLPERIAPAEPRTVPSPAPTPEPEPEQTEEPEAGSGEPDAGSDGAGSEDESEEEQEPQEYVLLRVPTPLVPPAPPEDSGAQAGIFTPLVDLLDRVGAR